MRSELHNFVYLLVVCFKNDLNKATKWKYVNSKSFILYDWIIYSGMEVGNWRWRQQWQTYKVSKYIHVYKENAKQWRWKPKEKMNFLHWFRIIKNAPSWKNVKQNILLVNRIESNGHKCLDHEFSMKTLNPDSSRS